jgi:hypothetical protein
MYLSVVRGWGDNNGSDRDSDKGVVHVVDCAGLQNREVSRSDKRTLR